MRRLLALAAAVVLVAVFGGAPDARDRARDPPTRRPATAVTFTADIGPLLNAKCQPCHFKGGKVFDRLPFDRYETAAKLGARLNTRLKGKDAELVTRWIEAGSPR